MPTDGKILKFYKNCNQVTSRRRVLISVMGTDTIFVVFSDTTFYIFSADKFNLLFIGPNFSRIDATCFADGIVYIGSGCDVIACERGVVKGRTCFNKRGESISLKWKNEGNSESKEQSNDGNKECSCYKDESDECMFNKTKDVNNTDYPIFIKQIVKLDSTICVLKSSNELVVTDDPKEVYRIPHVKYIFNPFAYINKLVIFTCNGKILLYNTSKRKVIYEYNNIKGDIIFMEQTKALDIVSAAHKGGDIAFYNLRKDRHLFTLKTKEAPTDLSFSATKMCGISEDLLTIWDLDRKKKILDNLGVYSAVFLDNKYMVVTFLDAVSIFEMCDNELHLIKTKHFPSRNIVDIGFVDSRSLFTVSADGISCIDIFYENKNFQFKYKGNVEAYDIGTSAVVYGNQEVRLFDLENKSSRCVIRTFVKSVCVYGSFIAFYSDKLYIVNSASGIVHKSYPVKFCNEPIGMKMDIDKVYIWCKHGMNMIDRYTGSSSVINFQCKGYYLFNGGAVMFSDCCIKFYNMEGEVFRHIRIFCEKDKCVAEIHSEDQDNGQNREDANFMEISSAINDGVSLNTEECGQSHVKNLENEQAPHKSNLQNKIPNNGDLDAKFCNLSSVKGESSIIDVCVSADTTLAAILTSDRVLLYDILTSTKLDEMATQKHALKIRFSSSSEFFCVLFADSSVVMYANKLFFAPVSSCNKSKTELIDLTAINTEIYTKFSKSRKRLCDELLLFKNQTEKKSEQTDTDQEKISLQEEKVNETALASDAENRDFPDLFNKNPDKDYNENENSTFGIKKEVLITLLDDNWIISLTKEETCKLIDLLTSHLDTSYEVVQSVLNKILIHKANILDPEDVKQFFGKFDDIYRKFEDSHLAVLGILGLEKEGLI